MAPLKTRINTSVFSLSLYWVSDTVIKPPVEQVICRDLIHKISGKFRQHPSGTRYLCERSELVIVLSHLERHDRFLLGHVIQMPVEAGGGFRIVDRTNNILEGFFHQIKAW